MRLFSQRSAPDLPNDYRINNKVVGVNGQADIQAVQNLLSSWIEFLNTVSIYSRRKKLRKRRYQPLTAYNNRLNLSALRMTRYAPSLILPTTHSSRISFSACVDPTRAAR